MPQVQIRVVYVIGQTGAKHRAFCQAMHPEETIDLNEYGVQMELYGCEDMLGSESSTRAAGISNKR
jgi:hypothetical protein